MAAEIPIREISTLAILVPLILSLRSILKANTEYRLLFIFLLVGLATDLFGWYVSSHLLLLTSLVYIITYYAVFEAIFFTWWIIQNSLSVKIKKIGRLVMIVNIIWIIFLPFNGIAEYGTVVRLMAFNAFYQIAVAFLSGFALLKMTEQTEKPAEIPSFWILMGIFVYCFSTFFVFVVKSSMVQEFADKLWPVHNIVNIFTYVLYSIGLWKYRGIISKA